MELPIALIAENFGLAIDSILSFYYNTPHKDKTSAISGA
nr:MAG TPA: hypothetical protein [Myoviridae sp. ctTS62]